LASLRTNKDEELSAEKAAEAEIFKKEMSYFPEFELGEKELM
jgi:hypothetical protein